jgi:transposase
LVIRLLQGHPQQLSDNQKRQILEFLGHELEAYGFSEAVWTRVGVAQVIEKEFGVGYRKNYAEYLLHELRWTPKYTSTEPSSEMKTDED